MASFLYKLLAQVQPGSSSGLVYSASSVNTIVRQVNVINTGISDCSFDLFQNGSATINKIGRGTTLVPKNDGTYDGALEYDCYWPMAGGNTLYAKAGISGSIVLNIWGVEIA